MVPVFGTVCMPVGVRSGDGHPSGGATPLNTSVRHLDCRSRSSPVGCDRPQVDRVGCSDGLRQQGTPPAAGAESVDRYPLRGLLYCACGKPLHPADLVDGSRGYRSTCGCRLTAVDASLIERLVANAVEREFAALSIATPAARLPLLARDVFAEIVVAGMADDLTFVPLV